MEELFPERREREEIGKKGKTKISVYFTTEQFWIYKKFKELCARKGLNISNYLRMLMVEEIKKHEQINPTL